MKGKQMSSTSFDAKEVKLNVIVFTLGLKKIVKLKKKLAKEKNQTIFIINKCTLAVTQ